MIPSSALVLLLRIRKTPWTLAILLSLAASVGSSAIASPIPTSEPIWTAYGSLHQEGFGAASAAGDFNGDGFSDIVVAAPYWGTAAMPYAGRIALFLGSTQGLSATPDWEYFGTARYQEFGFVIAAIGDVNRDGCDDLAVSDTGADLPAPYAGRVTVFLGAKRGFHQGPPLRIEGSDEDEYLGVVLDGAGDVNGDGYADFILSGNRRTSLYLGRASGLSKNASWLGPPTIYVVRGVGDVDRDGFDDCVVSASNGLQLYRGSSTGLEEHSSWTGPIAVAVAGGDFDGDGYGDLALRPGSLDASISLYAGSPFGLLPAPGGSISSLGPRHDSFFGLWMGVGDSNGDGRADLLVSSPSHLEPDGGGVRSAPSVFLFLGGSLGTMGSPSWAKLSVPRPFEAPLLVVADTDGNGWAEVFRGSSDNMLDGQRPGAAFLYEIGPAYPAPVIEHRPPAVLGTEGVPIAIEADVRDDTRSVARVEVLYRSLVDSDFHAPLVMPLVDQHRYRVTIPGTDVGPFVLYYKIRAIDDYGLASETDLIGIELLPAEGLAARARSSVRVLGSPGGGERFLVFQTTKAGPIRIQVFDVRGRFVSTILDDRSRGPGHYSVPIRGLPRAAGVYFYRVTTGDGVTTGRLVIAK